MKDDFIRFFEILVNFRDDGGEERELYDIAAKWCWRIGALGGALAGATYGWEAGGLGGSLLGVLLGAAGGSVAGIIGSGVVVFLARILSFTLILLPIVAVFVIVYWVIQTLWGIGK